MCIRDSSGTCYIMSNTTAHMLYATAMLVPAFHLEDVYITGILPSTYNRLLNQKNVNVEIRPSIFYNTDNRNHEKEIHPIHDERFNIGKIEFDACLYDNLISSHGLNPEEILHIHNLITKLRQTAEYDRPICSKYNKIKQKIGKIGTFVKCKIG